jgi:hypothetical protein
MIEFALVLVPLMILLFGIRDCPPGLPRGSPIH